MINKLIRGISQCHAKFNKFAMKTILCILFTLSYLMPMPHHLALAFWTFNKPGDEPQHWRITSLVRWPKNDPLFDTYWQKMGEWSEFPDRGKDPIVGHGIALFDKMDEKERAKLSFTKAVEHYSNYLRNRQNTKELEIAAQCLAHAYHYFEDVADFSQGDNESRVRVSSDLKTLHNYRVKELDKYNELIEKRRIIVNPDIDSIIKMLEGIRKQKNHNYIHSNLLQIVACLEQVNIYFLTQVRGNREPGGGGHGDNRQFDILGRIWQVKEGQNLEYPCTFTRIGNTNVFKAKFDWHADESNKVTITINGLNVTMERDQAPLPGGKIRRKCTYLGTLYKGAGSMDLNMAEGTMKCDFKVPENLKWSATILGQRSQ
jgi:hypothetical protein